MADRLRKKTEDIDIWRAAKLTIDEHGAGAWIHAALRIDELKVAGNFDGAAVWKRIADAIAKLDDMQASGEIH